MLTQTKVQIGYYCLEIFDLWKRYGEGHMKPNIEPEGNLLRFLVFRLTRASLYFEAMELIDYFIGETDSSLEPIILQMLNEDCPAHIEYFLRLAKSQAKEGDLEEAEATLSLVDQLIPDEHRTAKHNRDQIQQRFLDTSSNTLVRIHGLIQISDLFLAQDYFDGALDSLEFAAELHAELPTNPEVVKVGTDIHDRLRCLCERSGDTLSLMQFEFRRCDMICSLTEDVSGALERRDELLSSSFCSKLPFFERFHKRQWAEYFMLRQREDALKSAEKYIDYCNKYASDAEKSLAQNLRLQTLAEPARMSDDARDTLLQELRSELISGIEEDKKFERHLAQIEKQLLLVQVLVEHHMLQEEELETTLADAITILDEAESLSTRIVFKKESLFMKHEIAFLRCAAAAAANGDFRPSFQTAPSEDGGDITSETYRLSEGDLESHEYIHQDFTSLRILHSLTLSFLTDSAPLLRETLNKMNEEEKRVEQGHSLQISSFLIFKGVFYNIILENRDATIFDVFSEAGFESKNHCMSFILKCFEDALNLKEEFEKEIVKKGDNFSMLTARQAYATAPMELLLFEIASSICHQIDDNKLTWEWIQRRKARAYSASLWNVFNKERSSQILNLPWKVTLEDMLWVSSASSRTLVFVDWAPIDLYSEKLQLVTLTFFPGPEGKISVLNLVELPISVEEINEWKQDLDPARFDDADSQRILHRFQPAIQPLEELCKEGDILVLCPTAPLQNKPLHAVELGGKPLIERNPVLYTSSLSTLRSCMERLEAVEPGAERSKIWKAAVLGAYEDESIAPGVSNEREFIYNSLNELAHKLDTKPVLGPALTTSSFQKQATRANLLHFHGHGQHDEHDITSQGLELGSPGELLTLDAATTLDLDAAHVTLIACEGGLQDFSLHGDEPLGLLPAFLLGGATSVIGALWPIQSTTGRKFTQLFYEYFINHVDRMELGPIVNLAEALRFVSLQIRACEGMQTPYHWAAFVLYGAWFCGRKPGTW
jgi:CHAT domain-containing protein/tetratricopeptide (TPR) repeat protein